MGQITTNVVAIVMAAVCGIVAVANGGETATLSILEAIVAISIVALIVGWMTNVSRRFVLASIWLTIAVAWLSTIFMYVTTPSAFCLDNLHSCILTTVVAGTFLAASFVLTGPCLKLGARLRHSPAPSHKTRQPHATSKANPTWRSRDTCPACGGRLSQPIAVAAGHH